MSEVAKVLRITPQLYRDGTWPMAYDPFGGLQTQVWRITKELCKAGISQTVLTGHIPGYPRHSKHEGLIEIESVGLALPQFAASRLLGITWFFAVAKHLVSRRNDYDLVHIHFNQWIWCRFLAVICRRLGLPVVISLNTELWINTKFPRLLSNKHFNLSQWIERKTIKSVDCAAALTSKYANRLKSQLKTEGNNIVVIPDAVEIESFQKPLAIDQLKQFRKRFGIPDHKKIVTYIGRIRTEKGWEDFPKIAAELIKSDAFLLIGGDGPDRQSLEESMKKTAADDAWEITGYLNPEEVKTVLKISDILILPSQKEMFGSVLLEAMASGVPTVAYEVGDVSEVSGDRGAVCMVPVKNVAAFNQAILEILTQPQKRESLIKEGFRRVEKFSMKRVGSATISCYERIINPNSSPQVAIDSSTQYS
ncbi:MAG: glycosyltransferase family 4 protein [Verrucomicrobia bacterium]|nr:glycosyltransferase family 4 protein [Verrucomicrobiota bacterium]